MWLKFENNERNLNDVLINLDRATNITPTVYGGGLVFNFCNSAIKVACKDSNTRESVQKFIEELLATESDKGLYVISANKY